MPLLKLGIFIVGFLIGMALVEPWRRSVRRRIEERRAKLEDTTIDEKWIRENKPEWVKLLKLDK